MKRINNSRVIPAQPTVIPAQPARHSRAGGNLKQPTFYAIAKLRFVSGLPKDALPQGAELRLCKSITSPLVWIPAFAGMTDSFAGMTGKPQINEQQLTTNANRPHHDRNT